MADIVIDVAAEAAGSPGVAREFIYSKIDPTPPLVSLSIDDNTGITSWSWEILSQPDGATASLSTPTASTSTFTPDAYIPGTYLLQCTFNGGASYARNAVAWKTRNLDIRIPAPGETTEFGATRGWDPALQKLIIKADVGLTGNRQRKVINIVDCTAAPPTEASGDRYILDNTGGSVHADWDGAAKLDIVEFDGTSWDAYTPEEGWVAYVDAEDKDALYVDDGTPDWELRPAGYWDRSGTVLYPVTSGDTLAGGTGSGASLTLNSTSHATKGKVYIGGATGLVFDEVNDRVGIGTDSPTSVLDLQIAGTPKSTTDILEITNSGNAADMDGTGAGILFNQWYYDAATPAVADAGRIAIIAEQDWTSTGSTQDSYMSLQTALDGTVAEKIRITSGGMVGVGVNPTYKFTIGSSDNSNYVGIYHDNSNAYLKTDDGNFIFLTDEGTNTDTNVDVYGKGTGIGKIRCYDEDQAEHVEIKAASGVGYIGTLGSSPGKLILQNDAHADVELFTGAADGETRELIIHGYSSGDTSRNLSIGVGIDIANMVSFAGLSKYYFGGTVTIPNNLYIGSFDGDGTADSILQITDSTEPSSSYADSVQIYEKDSSQGAGHGTLGLYLEESVESIGTFTGSHKLRIWINGAEYWLQLDQISES